MEQLVNDIESTCRHGDFPCIIWKFYNITTLQVNIPLEPFLQPMILERIIQNGRSRVKFHRNAIYHKLNMVKTFFPNTSFVFRKLLRKSTDVIPFRIYPYIYPLESLRND